MKITTIKTIRKAITSLTIVTVLFSSTAFYFQPAYAQETTNTPTPPPSEPTPTISGESTPSIVDPLLSTTPIPADLSKLESGFINTTPTSTKNDILSKTLPTTSPKKFEMMNSARLKRKTKLMNLHHTSFQANEKLVVSVEKDTEDSVSLELFDAGGNEISAAYTQKDIQNLTTFEVNPPQSFTPGTYKMRITDSLGNVYEQDFTWGVMAINTNKSIYLPNEKAHLTMAVLNENGSMVCNAKLVLTIKRPGGETEVLSTENGDIKVHTDCTLKTYTLNPDYETTYPVKETGTYIMQLSAETVNGINIIQDQFEVRDSVAFDVERTGPTRIYPPKEYEVKLIVKANEDFNGTVEEIVPIDFTVHKDPEIPFDDEETDNQKDSGLVLGISTQNISMPFDSAPVITTKFGEQYDDQTLTDKVLSLGIKGHDGIDFALNEETVIKAVDNGKVIHAGNDPYGLTVIIEHEWGTTYYGHLRKTSVQEGEIVTKDQEIGRSGNTGNSTGPHLHFSIKPKDSNEQNGYNGMVNPLSYLGIDNTAVLGIQSDDQPDVRILKWTASMKKGETKTFKYSFKAPDISPEFYLLGPLRFRTNTVNDAVKNELLQVLGEKDEKDIAIVSDKDSNVIFQEIRKWQIAADADVTVDAAAILGTSRGMRNTVFTTTLIGYHFFVDADSDLKYYKTTDGGASWGGLTVVKGTETITGFDVWFDKWTPGDTGNKIHIWYVGTGASDIVYESLDTANTDTQSSEVIAFNGASSVAGRGVFVSGAKMRGGNLYVAFDIDAGAEKGVRRSTDSGANWTIRYTTGTTDTIVEATIDQGLLFPGNEADNQDLWILYQDASANALTLKMHDDSANTTSESATIVTLVENVTDGTGQYGFSGSILHSNGHLYVVTESSYDLATSDMQTWDINGTGSITQKTAISTDKDDQYYPQMYIDQSSSEIRVAYIGKRDGTDTLGTTNGVYYTTSTDGMANWSAGDSAYSATSSDWRNLWVPLMGPRFIAFWRDISSQAIMTNYDNSIANVVPTIALNSPADASSDTDTTPTLDFTGTDADGDSIEYNVQVHTSNTFGPTTITKSDLTSNSGTSATSFTTASITPTSNRLILLAVASRVSGGGNNVPTATGNGLTWQLVKTVKEAASWNMITLFRAMGSSPSTGAITIDFNAQTQLSAIWSVTEYAGIDTSGINGSGAIVQNATNTGVAVTSLTATLAAFSSTGNATYGVMVSEVNSAITQGSGFTEIHETNITDNSLESEWRNDNDTTVDWSWTPTARVAGIGIEIAAATSPLLNKLSVTPDTGFVNPDTGGDTHPFNTGENIQFTVQAGDALSAGTYYWRVRAADPAGTNTYGLWSATRSFTITAASPTLDQVMRHGKWFSSGVEQGFTF